MITEKIDSLGFMNDIEGASIDYTNSNAIAYDHISGISSTNEGIVINKLITTINKSKISNKKNEYIVVHYVGAQSTAKNNALYFYSENRNASANYFVDTTSIWQVVEDNYAAWHCGGGLQSKNGGTFYKKCTNSNSIGVELCHKFDKNGKAYFEEATLAKAVDLIKTLMQKYNIPIERVIRHYDVVGKYCPAPFVDNENAWKNFKARLVETPHWAKVYYDEFINKGYISSNVWSNYDENVPKSQVAALIDKITGGTWTSAESDPSIHWVQPHIISLSGKGYIDSSGIYSLWLTNPDALISRAFVLALIDKMTGGMIDKYKNRSVDHWARNHLDSLCDKGIINTPHAWDDDFELPINRGNLMALLSKTLKSGKIK